MINTDYIMKRLEEGLDQTMTLTGIISDIMNLVKAHQQTITKAVKVANDTRPVELKFGHEWDKNFYFDILENKKDPKFKMSLGQEMHWNRITGYLEDHKDDKE